MLLLMSVRWGVQAAPGPSCQSELVSEGKEERGGKVQGNSLIAFNCTSVPLKHWTHHSYFFSKKKTDQVKKEDENKGWDLSKRVFSLLFFNPGVLRGKDVFQFNLTTIQDSELILSASFHFLHKRPRPHQRASRFRRPRNQQPSPPALRLVFHGALGNVTLAPLKKGSWQTKDVTAAVKNARESKELVFTVEFDLEFRAKHKSDYVQERFSPANLPYILVYADDQAIDEPNSVALSLQRYGTLPGGEDASPSPSASRSRRELHRHQIQTNDIPEVHYSTLKNHELWQNTYFPAKAQSNGRRPGQDGPSKPQVLSFDERTMKKARKRQWSEPRACSRRYLRVDFADIGWSEWVLAPKSFDAYYCAGTCGFPIPKVSLRTM